MACLKYTYKYSEDWKNSDNAYKDRLDANPTEVKQELQKAESKFHKSELTCEIIEIYVDLLFPSMQRHLREVCKGCFHDDPNNMDHDVCYMMSKRAFLKEYLDKVTHPKIFFHRK